MKRTNRLRTALSLILAITMICSFALTASAETVDYITPGVYRPLVNEGEEITITIAVGTAEDVSREVKELWQTRYFDEVLNVKLEIIEVPIQAKGEWKSLHFGIGDLPDIMIGLNFSEEELFRYGSQEGQLLDLTPYLETYAPTLQAIDKQYGIVDQMLVNGGRYGMPYITDTTAPDTNALCMYFSYNKTWLDSLDLAVPTSIEEMMAAAQVIKDAAGTGFIPEDVIPVGGCPSYRWNLLNGLFRAMGWISMGNDWMQPARDAETGEFVVPIMEQEKAVYLLQYLKDLRDNGLMEEDYYTIGDDKCAARISEGKYAFTVYWAGWTVTEPDLWDWMSMAPLTSAYNSVPNFDMGNACYNGNFVVNADTKYPELCTYIGDYYLTPEGSTSMYNFAPVWDINGEYGLGIYEVSAINDLGSAVLVRPDGSGFEAKGLLDLQFTNDTPAMCINANERLYEYLYGEPMPEAEVDYSNNYYMTWLTDARKNVSVHGKAGLPKIFMAEEDTVRMGDLRTVLTSYITTEVARFVTGQRELSEEAYEAFIEELNGMGLQEYYDIFANYYNID